MPRRLRPLTLTDFEQLPASCAGCQFWESAGPAERRCGALCDVEAQAEWYHRVLAGVG